jgi:acetyl-CoA carboxylase carboxyltransferase component
MMIPKKSIIAIAGIVVVLGVFISRVISVAYWADIDWNMLSYHPLIPIIGLITGTCYCITVFLTAKGNIVFWFVGVSWIIISLIMFWAKFVV